MDNAWPTTVLPSMLARTYILTFVRAIEIVCRPYRYTQTMPLRYGGNQLHRVADRFFVLQKNVIAVGPNVPINGSLC